MGETKTRVYFIFKGISIEGFAALACSCLVTCLDEKIWDDAVEDDVVVVS